MKTQTTPKTTGAKKAQVTPKSSNKKAIMSTMGNTQNENNDRMNSLPQEQAIASRAYRIWQEQGCPEGFDEMHWRLAEQEILGVSSGGCAA